MDLRHLLAKEIADGIIATGVEGGFDSVSCSTAGNYPSMGVSQWEGSRGDNLLSWIDAGRKFMGRSYSDIVNAGELYELKHVLSSPQGQHAQREILAYDCLVYADALMPLIADSKCVIYAGIYPGQQIIATLAFPLAHAHGRVVTGSAAAYRVKTALNAGGNNAIGYFFC